MNEALQLLHNMSSSSRSTVAVQPRHVEPPPTTARGARMCGNVCITVGLSISFGHGGSPTPRLQWLAKTLLPKEQRPKHLSELARALQVFANATIARTGLIGCVIMHDPKQLETSGGRHVTITPIANDGLAFAILTKTSDRLFITTKTPNLAPHLLERTLVTFDPRIVALIGGRP